jgi:hypothetical protein
LVQVAGSGGGIEDGAGLGVADAVFGFVCKERRVFVVYAEDAAGAIPGEERIETGEGFGYTDTEALCSLGILPV